jgi:hypothetical protein
MTLTHETLARPAQLARAVRTVDRWGLLAGVTGFLGNVLLLVLITTPADGRYAWTGPANDIVSSVATLALIPVAVGLLAVCGNSRGLGAITSLAILAMLVTPAVTLLFVLGLLPFDAATYTSYVDLIVTFGWILAVSRAGRPTGRLPRQIAGSGIGLGAAGLAGAALLAVLVPVPAHLLSPDITYASEWLTGIPVALYPVWLIVLSYRLPGHLAGGVGNDAPHPPGQGRP